MRLWLWLRFSLELGVRAALSPRTGAALIAVAWRFRRREWYRRLPFIPIPDREYLRWRMLTAYGDANAIPPTADVIRYATWATND